VASPERSPTATIEAAALIPAEPEEVFDFLSDLGNHWLLASRFIEVVELDRSREGGPCDSGIVRLRGPLGLHRTVHTKVTAVKPARLLIGTAEVGGVTRARVSWTLARRLHETRVRLAAEVDVAETLDRLLLALGGRRWLEHRFAETLEALAAELAARRERLRQSAVA
jgi:hypothetical protein